MKCPCKGCTDRWVSETSRCHAFCDKYKEWQRMVRAVNHIRSQHAITDDLVGGVLFGKGGKQR